MAGRAASSVSRFLVDLSDLLVDAGPCGFLLVRASLAPPYGSELAYASGWGGGEVASVLFPLALGAGETFESHAQRRAMFWQPAPMAPAYLQVAWVVSELHNELTYFAEESLDLVSLSSVDPRYLELALVRDGDPVTVRLRVEGRTAPLDFPATAVRERLTEGPPVPAGPTAGGRPVIDLDV